jgi:hypothetical protein
MKLFFREMILRGQMYCLFMVYVLVFIVPILAQIPNIEIPIQYSKFEIRYSIRDP